MTANDEKSFPFGWEECILENKNWDAQTMEGTLPAAAPLANPYVPFQRENAERYEARTGMIRGTMYPGLDLPFMGKVNTEPLPVTPLSELQVLGFALHDLALYLDTHRNDAEALEIYRAYQKMYAHGLAEYQSERPLTHDLPTQAEGYAWLRDPWPWEYEA